MKKIIQIMLVMFFMSAFFLSTVNADSDVISNSETDGKSTQQLIELKKHEEATLDGYKEKYGSDTYGVTAYILDKVRIYSIPLVFIGIAFSAVHQYVIGLKRLDARNIGFGSMIAVVTIGIICQILPLVFAIVVTSTEKQ